MAGGPFKTSTCDNKFSYHRWIFAGHRLNIFTYECSFSWPLAKKKIQCVFAKIVFYKCFLGLPVKMEAQHIRSLPDFVSIHDHGISRGRRPQPASHPPSFVRHRTPGSSSVIRNPVSFVCAPASQRPHERSLFLLSPDRFQD